MSNQYGKPETFLFSGQTLTVRQVRDLHPRYGLSFLRRALRAGAKSEDDLRKEFIAAQKRLQASHRNMKSPWRNGFTTPLSPRAI